MADLDIAAFLRARLDEAENGGKPDRHTAVCGYTQIEFVSDECTCGDPAFVLADVAAKRQIIAMHERAVYSWGSTNRAYCRKCAMGDSCDECLDYETQVWPCSTLSLLALPYAGHPDYREEWKP